MLNDIITFICLKFYKEEELKIEESPREIIQTYEKIYKMH